MATDLTPELRQAIEASSGPLELVDQATNKHYFVVQAEMYHKLIETLDLSEPSDEEKKGMLQRFGKSLGWDDPSYDGLI